MPCTSPEVTFDAGELGGTACSWGGLTGGFGFGFTEGPTDGLRAATGGGTAGFGLGVGAGLAGFEATKGGGARGLRAAVDISDSSV